MKYQLSDIKRHPVFSATMSKMRFQFNLANLVFDDLSDREMCQKEDRIAAMRYVFKERNKIAKAMVPDFYFITRQNSSPCVIKHNTIRKNQLNMARCIKRSIAPHFHIHIRVTFIAETRNVHQMSFIYLVQRIVSNISLQIYQLIMISEPEI